MENILFYPILTPEKMDACGLSVEKYRFTYVYNGNQYALETKGATTIKLSDPLDIWKVESEGFIIDRVVRIAYPNLLKGEEGIVCQGADIGICIVWTNKKLTQTGHILPIVDNEDSKGRICKFHHEFAPGTISGDLELSLEMFVKNKAEKVLANEQNLINEEGVTVGEIDYIELDFSSLYMEFPVVECKSESEPLWWLETSNWEDPKTIDMFSKDSFCLYLNTYYESCPAPSLNKENNGTKNFEMLVDILAQTYLLLFEKLEDDDLEATIRNIGLANYSICSILHQFIEDCYVELNWESPEALLKSLQINIRKKLQET